MQSLTRAAKFAGTTPVGVRDLDVNALEAYLCRNLDGFKAPLQVRRGKTVTLSISRADRGWAQLVTNGGRPVAPSAGSRVSIIKNIARIPNSRLARPAGLDRIVLN